MNGPSTRSVHADRALAELPDVAPAIRPSTTHAEGTGRRYRRGSHETTERFEAVIGSLEGGHAVAYSSGMAAATAAIDLVEPERMSLPEVVYYGVRNLAHDRQRRGTLELVDAEDLGEGDLLWLETPSNPFCDITDVVAATRRATEQGAITVVDATLATPVNLRALCLGADIVMHSTTKAIAGHSDAMGGVLVCGDRALAEQLKQQRILSGAIPGSLDVWLALRGVRTLALRAERAAHNAGEVARTLADLGATVWYPGLPAHPGHEVAATQMETFGSMLAIDVGSARQAEAFVSALSVFTSATSLGGVESLAEIRAISDATIAPGVVRLSVGIEDAADLVVDISNAYRESQRS